MPQIKRGRGRPRKIITPDPTEAENEFNNEEFLPEESVGIMSADEEVGAVNDELENADIIALLSSPGVMGSVVKLSKINDTTLIPEYITSFPAKNFNPEQIKKMYGGGEYLMAIVRSNGKVVKHAKFNISRMFKGDINIKNATEPAATGTNGEQGLTQLGMQLANMLGNKLDEIKNSKNEGDSILPLLMQQQRESAQMQMAMLVEMAKSMRPAQSTSEPGSWIGICTPIILELIRNSKKEGSSLNEMIGALVQLRSLTPEGGGDIPETKEKSFWEKLLESVAPALAPALVPALMQHVQKNAVMPALPPKTAVPSMPPVKREPLPVRRENLPVDPKIKPSQNEIPPVTNTVMPPSNNHVDTSSSNELTIAKIFPFLLTGAKTDTDPHSYYDMALVMLKDEEVAQLTLALANENWAQIIFGDKVKEIEPYMEWFEELRDCFIAPDEEDEETDSIRKPTTPTEIINDPSTLASSKNNSVND